MSLLHRQALLTAAHACYAAVYADEYEGLGGKFHPCCSIFDQVARLPDSTQLPIIWRYVGRVEGAWGRDLGLVLYHMGLTTADQQGHALSLLLLGCLGHGVGLCDEWAEGFEAACEKLGIAGAAESPILFEPAEWRDAASNMMHWGRLSSGARATQ